MELLLTLLKGGSPEKSLELGGELMIRGSTAPPSE
jgi:hypothetical protein